MEDAHAARGAPATTVCRSCGAAPHEDARFCDACGTQLTASADAAEYKQVTVLFADVVRSSEIAAAVDIERLREIMTSLVERSAAVAQRYGGTVEYNGDGVMALFGAPVALEDHALRGCLAALAIQEEAAQLAADVARRDGVALRVRVGLNSGRVIAGEIGSGSLGYAATGEAVGFAQRMESAAPPGGVMLSESTVRLVEHAVKLGEPEWVQVKGFAEPVRVRRLTAIGQLDGRIRQDEASLVGRRWEMAALDALADRAIGGRGGVVNVVGPPGIGKSRVAREVAAVAANRGMDVFWTFCESHASDVPFYAVTRLLRAIMGVADLDGDAARGRIREHVAGADPDDLLLLDDLLGVADPDVPLPQIAPDARRRRLTALINTVSLARTEPALVIIEDAHWIDAVSETLLSALLAVIPHTPSMVLITARPEYEGALTRVHGAQTIALAALGDSDTATLLTELLGSDPSVGELTAIIVDRAHGNPFFAEEIVRELAQRGVLTGQHGNYSCGANASDVAVPATVQAAIEARIDRLSSPAKRALCAASVIGARFSAQLLAALVAAPPTDELLAAELIDQVQFTPGAEYAFRHPLIRAVAYESQLKSDRAQCHRLLATAIQDRDPAALDENAGLIAEHLESAGDLHAAYGWQMRAAAWSTSRDFCAARLCWERARRIADALPEDDADRLSMRIAPRTMLCASDFHAIRQSGTHFTELRDLCNEADDKVSLAIGMTGLVTERFYSGRSREGSRMASEQMALLESIGDPTLTVGLSFVALVTWFDSGEFDEILRWSQIVIDLAEGDPTKGADFGMGSPLAAATALRGSARWWLGRPGWRQDLRDALAMARDIDPTTRALILAWTCVLEICCGVLRADDATLQMIEEAVRIAEASSYDFGLGMAEYTLGVMLLHRDDAAERQRGLEMMAPAEDMWRDRGPHLLGTTQLAAGREMARCGDRDAPLQVMREAVDDLHRGGRHPFSVWGTSVFVEALLMRGTSEDLAESEMLIERLESQRADRASAMLDITLLRMRALLAGARGDDGAYRCAVNRYRAMAESLGFEGHIAWAEAM